MKSNDYVDDDFETVIQQTLPFFLLLMYLVPVFRLISRIVSEKETKAREGMKMMGLKDFPYWLSWFVYYFTIMTLISLVSLLIVAGSVFEYSNKGYVFLFFWLYGASLFGFSVFVSSLFFRARVASISGTLLYFISSFADAAVADTSVSEGAKTAASLLPTVSIYRGCNNLGKYEASGIGVTSENASDLYENYRFSTTMWTLTVSFIILTLLGLYLDNVLPSAYGVRKPWYFLFTKSYWAGYDKDELEKRK